MVVASVTPTSFRAIHQSYPLMVDDCLLYTPSYVLTESVPVTCIVIDSQISVGARVGEGVVGAILGAKVGCLVSKHTIVIVIIVLG